jgi:FkbM family methyltransferase
MKFYYGYDQDHLVDITEVVENKCLIEDEYCIPSNDNQRAKIFGDPYYGKLKSIFLEIAPTHFVMILSHQSVIIPKNIEDKDQIQYVENSVLRKKWMEKKGQFIQDPIEKLKQLQNWIVFSYGTLDEEYEEQVMAIRYIEPSDKVLELGANFGRNSCLISSLLNDDTNLVTLETCNDYIPKLEFNRNSNQFRFQIEPAGLSKKKLIQKKWITFQWEMDNLPDNEYFWVPTITWTELQQKYPIDFNVLVADCEGALFYILQDEPDFLNGFNKILIENDYVRMEQYEFVKNKFLENGFKNVFNLGGGLSWHCCKDCFYQVWIK